MGIAYRTVQYHPKLTEEVGYNSNSCIKHFNTWTSLMQQSRRKKQMSLQWKHGQCIMFSCNCVVCFNKDAIREQQSLYRVTSRTGEGGVSHCHLHPKANPSPHDKIRAQKYGKKNAYKCENYCHRRSQDGGNKNKNFTRFNR